MNADSRRAFKLMDLMVTILVVALLLGVLVPFLGHSRDTGLRNHCQNNLRQLGLGVLGFYNARNCFPNAGTIFDDPAVHGGDPAKSNIYRSISDPASLPRFNNPWLSNWVVEILPYIDNQELYNAYDKTKSYLDPTPNTAGGTSNLAVSSTTIGILRCPEDDTLQLSNGNLSYAVNGGFARWYPIPIGWTGGRNDGQSKNGGILEWTPPGNPWQETQKVGQKLGVSFLGTQSGDQPWDIRTAASSLSDGATTTLLLGENRLVGYSSGNAYSNGLPTNWACPLPNFCMFLASDDVCRSTRSSTGCLDGQLRPKSATVDGPGWAQANRSGTYEDINYGRRLTVEGSFPFANGGHIGGSNFVFCEGSVRFITDTIDGTVYAKIITPAGSQLPDALKQRAVSVNDILK